MLAASMPPVGLALLAWISLVPLLAVVPGTNRLVGALGGLVTALTAALVLDLGLMPVPHPMAGEPNWIFGGYCLFGLLLAIVCYELSGLKEIRFRNLPYLAAFGVCLEAAMSFVLPIHMALSQYKLPAALWLASIAGIWGVSFVVWLTLFLLAKGVRLRAAPWWPYYLWIGVVGLGIALLRSPSSSRATGLKIGIIQTQSNDPDQLAALNIRAGAMGAKLVIWPELSGMLDAPSGDTTELRALSEHWDQPAFVTSFEDSHRPKPHNVAALFSAGTESQRYFKRKPFAAEQMMHEAGTEAVVAKWAVPVGLNICFDACYPWVLRDTVQKGAAFIALPTEDPPSKNGIVQALHSAYMPFRSAELGVAIYRADITAYSTVTGPDGQILTELNPGEGVAVQQLPAPHDTVYRRLGDWFLYLCIAFVLIWFLAPAIVKLRKRAKKQDLIA